MNRAIFPWRLLPVGMAVAILLMGASSVQAPALVHAPLAETQGYSYSVAANGPSAAMGFHPADILGAGGMVLIPCANLGLICDDPVGGGSDDVAALSYGDDFTASDLPPVHFSVAAGAQGAGGSAVRGEAGCSPAQPQADAFQSALDGANAQDLDGDGVSCGSGSGFGLALVEGGASLDNLDALERDPCQSVDFDCNGEPDAPLWFSLAAGSPSLAAAGATAGAILVTRQDLGVTVWASAADLGLGVGDAINALCLRENGDGVYDSDDLVMFSLAPGSPTLTALKLTSADLLRTGPLRVAYRGSSMGLAPADALDAATCNSSSLVKDLYLPLMSK